MQNKKIVSLLKEILKELKQLNEDSSDSYQTDAVQYYEEEKGKE